MNNKRKSIIWIVFLMMLTIPITIGIIPSSVQLFGWFLTLFTYILSYILSFLVGFMMFFPLLEFLEEMKIENE